MNALDAAALAKFFADFADRHERFHTTVFLVGEEEVPLSAVRAALDRLVELERGVAAIAHAVGIEHAPDQGPSYPGSVEEIAAETKRLVEAKRRREDFEADAYRLLEDAGIPDRLYTNDGIMEASDPIPLIDRFTLLRNALSGAQSIVIATTEQRDAARSARDNLRGQRDRAEWRVARLEAAVQQMGKCTECHGHGAVLVNAHGAQEVACHECDGTGLTADARAVLAAADSHPAGCGCALCTGAHV